MARELALEESEGQISPKGEGADIQKQKGDGGVALWMTRGKKNMEKAVGRKAVLSRDHEETENDYQGRGRIRAER